MLVWWRAARNRSFPLAPLREAWLAVGDFLYAGGDVLWPILIVTFAMWFLILERHWYFWRDHPAQRQRAAATWETRRDRSSWRARAIRSLLISEVDQQLRTGISTVKTLVALCPLLGLLGTVTGMIEVFEVMAVAGTGNVRAMSAGVAKATIPTMAGMMAALSGLYFSVSMERFAQGEHNRLSGRLLIDATPHPVRNPRGPDAPPTIP